MKMPYLGKIDFYWCWKCNVPVLGKKCGICEEGTERVDVTPPGDVRPAFKGDIDLINEVVRKRFGCALIPLDKVVVLNRAPGHDRFDEVIFDGKVQGALKYDIRNRDFDFLPRLEGARRIWEKSKKKFVEVHPSAKPFILKGASVLLPGVVDYDDSIGAGEEVIVVSEGEVIAVGRSRLSASEAAERDKGMFVKIRRYGKPQRPKILPGGQDWHLVLEANREIIGSKEEEALNFIHKLSRDEKPKIVAFSGGKDSLATLLLVRKVIPDIKVAFTDTGLEFPEIIEGTKKIVRDLGLELISEDSGDSFWKGLEYFGPPGRDFRWCCKLVKLGPMSRLIYERFRGGCISFIGQRKYESEVRSRSRRIWRNPWIPVQVGASPIQHWTALHVWLYLLKEGVEANILYDYGMERLGCWVCPASDLGEIEILKRVHPELWRKWEDALKKAGLSEEEIEYGFWRWRRLGKGQSALAEELGVTLCERKVSRSGRFDFERAANFAKVIGKVTVRDGVFEVRGYRVYRDGRYDAEMASIVERASNCFGCGVCLSQCEKGAIEIREGKAWIGDSCTSCGRCHQRCPIVKYGNGWR
jgi:phosphoadenosine phosphosulfate reductase